MPPGLLTFFNVVGIALAVVFSGLVFLTGKGDAMSGSQGVRTTFKGKASFDDLMLRVTLITGGAFMVWMLVLDIAGNHVKR